MSVSDAQRRASKKYDKEHLSQIRLTLPNKEFDFITEYCKVRDIPRNKFIREVAISAIEADEIFGKKF